MNYRHIYHAGGLADLIKHITLVHILKRLAQKPAAFCVLDTHAAIGLYDLAAEETKKTGESDEGIGRFSSLPFCESLQPFQDVLTKYNGTYHDCGVRFYPGSPALIKHYLRSDDRLIVIEKHKDDAATLARLFGQDPQINIHTRDAWEAMKAFIPFKEKRSFVFIDPPYELPTEMDDAVEAIFSAYKKSAHSVFALWYPLKDPVATGRLHEQFRQSALKKVLRIDVPYKNDNSADKMVGSGMIIINPPWQIEESLANAMQALSPLFESGCREPVVEWLRE